MIAQGVDLLPLAHGQHFHAAIREILHVTGESQRRCPALHEPAESHALHAAMDDKAASRLESAQESILPAGSKRREKTNRYFEAPGRDAPRANDAPTLAGAVIVIVVGFAVPVVAPLHPVNE